MYCSPPPPGPEDTTTIYLIGSCIILSRPYLYNTLKSELYCLYCTTLIKISVLNRLCLECRTYINDPEGAIPKKCHPTWFDDNVISNVLSKIAHDKDGFCG